MQPATLLNHCVTAAVPTDHLFLLRRMFRKILAAALGQPFRTLCSAIPKVQAASTLVHTSPLDSPDYFGLKDIVTIRELFQARVHIGHRSLLRNEYMIPYIFGCRQGIDIIDLDQTWSLLFDALNFTAHIAYRNGIILFICQNQQMLPLVEKTAREAGEFSCCRHYPDGVFTDAKNVLGEVARLPDLIILLSAVTPLAQSHLAVRDAAKMLIPTVGIVDTNADPRLVTYPVPGSDDGPITIRLWCALFAAAIRKGKRRAIRELELRQRLANPTTSENPHDLDSSYDEH